MYLCIEQNNNLVYKKHFEVQNLSDCTGYIAQDVNTLTQLPTLFDLFNVPLMTDLQTMFEIGFTVPLIAYLASWAFGTLINWFSKPDEF